MVLSQNGQVMCDETTIADTMNQYFYNITKKWKFNLTNVETKHFIKSTSVMTYFN